MAERHAMLSEGRRREIAMSTASARAAAWRLCMTRSCGWSAGVVAVLSILTTNTAAAQLMSTCVPDSPERRGEIGCSIIQSKPLPEGLTEPVFWHIDRFDSPDRARAAVGPASIAFDAAGVWWLMTIERDTTDHHGGQHVTRVGPLPLPRAARYAMMVQSAMFMPGMYSLPHHRRSDLRARGRSLPRMTSVGARTRPGRSGSILLR